MEGNERITLYEPGAVSKDSLGRPTRGAATAHTVWARRQDRGGRELVYGDQRSGNWSVRFEVRRFPSIAGINESWYLSDARGRAHDIEAVSEVKGVKIHWWIYAVRRES